MSLWWLQPGWKDTRCAQCGARIWPEGDPDWGLCAGCFEADLQSKGKGRLCACGNEAVANAYEGGPPVCSAECQDEAMARRPA